MIFVRNEKAYLVAHAIESSNPSPVSLIFKEIVIYLQRDFATTPRGLDLITIIKV